jgi:hypothetical protein
VAVAAILAQVAPEELAEVVQVARAVEHLWREQPTLVVVVALEAMLQMVPQVVPVLLF